MEILKVISVGVEGKKFSKRRRHDVVVLDEIIAKKRFLSPIKRIPRIMILKTNEIYVFLQLLSALTTALLNGGCVPGVSSGFHY